MAAPGKSITKYSVLFLAFALVFFTQACKEKKSKPQVTQPTEKQRVEAPVFNADSAYYFVEKQVSFGPRVPGSAAHSQCADWLIDRIDNYADTVIRQDFRSRIYDGRTVAGVNIIASFKPQVGNRILLCAHWDSRPYADHDSNPANHRKPILGANDGGSGVGVLLEIARLMSIQNPDKGVDIVFFDLEDWGEPEWSDKGVPDSWALGAQHWSKNPHRPGYSAQYGILLDMVGAKDAVFTMEGYSMRFAPDIMRRVWNEAHASGYGRFFSMKETGMIADDHYYVNIYAGIPTIDIIQHDPESPTGFFRHWHTVNDDMSHISRETLKATGQVVLNFVYNN
jgi:hypothetical protein